MIPNCILKLRYILSKEHSSCPSSKKLPFAENSDHYRKGQLVKIHKLSMWYKSQRMHCSTILEQIPCITLTEKAKKQCKSQTTMLILCSLELTGSNIHDTTTMLAWDSEIPQESRLQANYLLLITVKGSTSLSQG